MTIRPIGVSPIELIVIACEERFTSWEDTEGVNPIVDSIEFFGYEKGSPA